MPNLDYLAIEMANYRALERQMRMMPGAEMVFREDIVMSLCPGYPYRDANHASLLRTEERHVDDLIEDMRMTYEPHQIPVVVCLSPVCQPVNLGEHLTAGGFVFDEKEYWLGLDLQVENPLPKTYDGVDVRLIETDADVLTFAEIFLAGFEMPLDIAPMVADMMKPVVSMDGVYYYIASVNGEDVGTNSLYIEGDYGVIASSTILPTKRGGGAILQLFLEAIKEGQHQGKDLLMTQTVKPRVRRMLSRFGFFDIFVRDIYQLPLD